MIESKYNQTPILTASICVFFLMILLIWIIFLNFYNINYNIIIDEAVNITLFDKESFKPESHEMIVYVASLILMPFFVPLF